MYAYLQKQELLIHFRYIYDNIDALEKIRKRHNTSTEKGDNYRQRKHAMRNRLPFKVDQMSNQ